MEKTLIKEIKETYKTTKERFESEPIESRFPNTGFGGGNISQIGDQMDFNQKVKDAYKEIFLNRGEEFTKGYVEGRRGRIGNLFNSPYKAAHQALEEMTEEGGAE